MTDNLPVPVGSNLESLAQAHENEALALYVETMRNTEIKIEHRLKAADAVLNRARGMPRAPQQKDPNAQRNTKAVRMSVETLMKIVQKASARVAHSDAVRVQADVLEGEFTPAPRRRPVNEHALPAPSDVEDLLK